MLILYGTESCHLCDEAQGILRQFNLVWQNVDIIEDDTLLQRYGTTIPVLRRQDNGRELYWPFGAQEIQAFIQQR